MVSRPVFIPKLAGRNLVEERSFEFKWASGFAEIQKKKNIISLHEAAKRAGIYKILEISSKSDEEVGRRLSAFSLKISLQDAKYPLESVYQGSKVFEKSGPFTELFLLTPREAKRYFRENDFGRLIGFRLEGKSYPLSPKNAFYDWLYIRCLADHADWIKINVNYDAFTDIEFNPIKQVNCQARAFAEYLSLLQKHKLQESVSNFETFAGMLPAL